MNNLKCLGLACSLFLLMLQGSLAQENAKVKMVYIYNFTKYINWPQEDKLKQFEIGVYGNNPELIKELQILSSNKQVHGLPIVVKNFKNLDEINPVQLLYVNANSGVDQTKVFNKIKGKGTLLVGENLEFFDHSMINFIVQDDKQKFSLNQKVMEKEGFVISTNLLAIAILDNKGWKDVYDKFRELLNSDKEKIEVNKKDLQQVVQTYEDQKKALTEQILQIEKQNLEKIKSMEEIEQLNFEQQAKALKILALNSEINQKKLEAENKEKENELLKKQKDIQEAESNRQRIITWAVACGLLLVLGFAIFVTRSLRTMKKQKEIIELKNRETELQKHIIEEKNKDIIDSIHYAKRIQTSILPNDVYIDKQLKRLQKK